MDKVSTQITSKIIALDDEKDIQVLKQYLEKSYDAEFTYYIAVTDESMGCLPKTEIVGECRTAMEAATMHSVYCDYYKHSIKYGEKFTIYIIIYYHKINTIASVIKETYLK